MRSHYVAPPAMAPARPAQPVWPSGDAGVTLSSSIGVRAHVTVQPRKTSEAAGIAGPVVLVQRDEGQAGATPVHLSLDYGAFADAFGGDWAQRLQLVTLPSCALSTPEKPECRTRTPLTSTRDNHTSTLATDLVLPAATPSTASAMVIAADSTPSGGGGDFGATSLQPSGSWQAGKSSDAFSWSYPITVPDVPGGLEPKIALSYNSQAVDGLISSTNNQPSWIGDGWDYNPGYIERSYQSCHENPDGPTKTYDNCWANNTLTLSLNGHASTLVKDDATGTYHPQDDSGERVQYLTGAANGAFNGEHFVVTTTDGTQYFFGLNQLPGWASGNPVTNSVWTEPVFATAADQPCYNSTFANAWCQQAYRWNLDYVVDTHSDIASYFYTTESNFYARNLGKTADTSYVRGGYLSKVQYGQRAGAVYTSTPAAQVLFTTTGRCTQSTCDVGQISSHTADWPDVPYDLNCSSGAACSSQAPSFWSEYSLQSIQAQALVGTTETNVDSWALTKTFPATGDASKPALWLSSIVHTGQDSKGGGSTTPISLPPVTFTGRPLSNRVNLNEGYDPITRQRLTEITTETGEVISVNYSSPGCASGTPVDPAQNTALCYPGYWTPTGHATPILDWFNKFIVTGVTERDPTGGSANDTIATTYTPVGTPAWHHNDNPITPADKRTWDQWRGYAGMIVTTGTAPDPVSKTQYTFFRGMDGDTLPNNGTRTASVSDSRGDPTIPDSNQYAGVTYEVIAYNGSAVVTDTITDPWTSAPTATQSRAGLPAAQSFLTGVNGARVYTPLAAGGTRETLTLNTHDALGRVTTTDDQGDVATASDDLCTRTTFADNTSSWILDKPAEVKVVATACSATPSLPTDAVSDALSFYDGSTTLGAAPSIGDATMTQQADSYNAGAPHYATMAVTTVDQYGRPLTATDADNRKTSTTYTPATGAQPTAQSVTDPLTHVSSTTLDPLRGLTLATTDTGGFVTTQQYDALGRVTAVNKPGVTSPAYKYTYDISNTGPSIVTTQTLNFDGTYRSTETLYDSMLRAREVQQQTPDNGRDITDTIYNTNGLVSETTDPYFNSDPISNTYVQAQAGQVPSATATSYDGAGRKTASIANALGSETWRTSYVYGGNVVTTIPPAGATATSTYTDARGHTTDLYRYHTGAAADPALDAPGDYEHTRYTYEHDGKQATVVDAAGNTWSYQYNLLGQEVSTTDPDAGTSTSTYDLAGQLLSTSDARGKQSTTTYDNGGRKTAIYDTTGGAAPSATNMAASWTYDTLKKGYPTGSTTYSGGDTVTQNVRAYNAQAQPQAVTTTITGEDAALFPAAGYTVSYGYSTTGYPTAKNEPAIDGLPTENVTSGYDAFGEATSVASSLTTYVQAVGYSEYGQPTLYTMPAAAGNLWLSLSYDQQTHALIDAQTTGSGQSTVVDDTSYSYTAAGVSKGAGLITSRIDQQNGGAIIDAQCFQYDYADRLAQAWSATDRCATSPTPEDSTAVGGPNPYWQSWTYDTAGNRRTQIDHDAGGNTANDTTTTYNYPAAATLTSRAHTLTGTTATGPAATANTASYTYDVSGNTTGITGGATGDETLTWNDQGKLASATTKAGTTSYVYDNSGNQLLRRDPGKVTLFLDDQQLVLDTATHAVSGTRYYAIGGTTIAERSSAGPIQYLIPDHQGTAQLAIDSATFKVTRRQYLPFGQNRGTVPSAWPGDLGYVGGTLDPDTNLENLGAREYDPSTGRFLSPDPVFQANDPSQLGGYAYAANNPATRSDPTGEDPREPCSKYDTRACTPEVSDYLNGDYDELDGCDRNYSTAVCSSNQVSGPVTPSRNYTTLHNKVAVDAGFVIWTQAKALGMIPLRLITSGFRIQYASKSCKDVVRSNCRNGFADIYLQASRPGEAGIFDYIWEVKKYTIGPAQAQKEAQHYVDHLNRQLAAEQKVGEVAQLGWDIGGPYQGTQSGPNTRFWGGMRGAVIYGKIGEVNDRLKSMTANGEIQQFDVNLSLYRDYQVKQQSANGPTEAHATDSASCSSLLCKLRFPISPPVVEFFPVPVP
ncbi:RHS repeat-associated core domain-containing protein [Amycolatopsis bartoniae]|nr:RHS repeat-associated core domain-containing protein [Amycolatopsis bartoniae]